MPYEEITKEQYIERAKKLKPLNLGSDLIANGENPKAEQFCDSDHCTI